MIPALKNTGVHCLQNVFQKHPFLFLSVAMTVVQAMSITGFTDYNYLSTDILNFKFFPLLFSFFPMIQVCPARNNSLKYCFCHSKIVNGFFLLSRDNIHPCQLGLLYLYHCIQGYVVTKKQTMVFPIFSSLSWAVKDGRNVIW